MNFPVKIKSEKITEAVSNLCKQANIYISKDVYKALLNSYQEETSEKSRNALGQILENLRIAAELKRPMCQDTGIVIVFAEIGQNIIIEGKNFEEAVNLGVEKAYIENFFRKSTVKDPIFERINTGNNTPAIIHTSIVSGNSIKISVCLKGAGSENMSTAIMLKPSAGIEGVIDFVVETVKNAGANPCPPIRLGIGIGGTLEYAAVLSKKALFQEVKTEQELTTLSENNKLAALELDILKKTNSLKIGTAGLGGNTTVFGINILTYSTHIASLSVAVTINCHASRHAEAEIFENDIKYDFENFQYQFENINIENQNLKKLNTEDIESLRNLKAGEQVLLKGFVYTARDAAHKRMMECIDKGQDLPVEIKDKIIYYVGPCPAKENEIIGPAGPTTSSRMDKYVPILMKQKGLLGSIGKGNRSEEVINSIKDNKGVYFIATGGAACLLAQKIISAEVIAYPDLGPEAIYKLELQDFPVTVAIDSTGCNFL